MQNQRVRTALDRIDRAIERIEAVAAAEPSPPPEPEELKRLRAAHAVLRQRVESAIGEIDALLDPGAEEPA